MAGELVSFGIKKLCDLLSQEYQRFQGVDDQVTELKRELDLLSSFLKDANAKKHTSAVVRNFLEQIKEIIYDAEDIVETFLQRDKLEKPSGIKNRIRRLACTIPERRETALDIGGISKRISKVTVEMEKSGVQKIIVDGGYNAQPLHDRQRESRQTFSKEDECDLVGLEENTKKLVELMVKEDNVQVVSITGMGGLGKTTLARQVFNHEMVKNKFDGLAWVCVSQEFNRTSVWQTILQNLTLREMNEILPMTEATLQGELFELLKTSKSLIVLDDIWKEEDWCRIKPIFPLGKGWKVLLTSRNESVTGRGNTTYINFKPECLTNPDSWTLFQRIAMPSESKKVDEKMEEIGKQIIEHCGGLPLAVRVLGGLLATKYTVHDWKRVYENIGSHIVGGRTDFSDNNNSSFNHVLSLSFEELPSYLKHCFLSLAHFPEDYQISVETMSYYWAAEGILKPMYYDGEAIRDVGDVYIEELVRRNMVISKRDIKTLRFETCHMHDMMREICLFKAKEENFLQINSICSSTENSRSRRFVLQYPTTLDVERDIKNPKLRSLLIVMGYGRTKWTLSGSSFTRLELLRVLDFFGAKFEGGELPSSIGNLIHLRYLSLEDAEVSHLPFSLGNLKLLIYLNLRLSGEEIFVPNVLMGMQELRYLALPWQLRMNTKLELSNLEKLETLENFSTENSSLEDLHGMARLSTLAIILTGETSLDILSASISGLRYLEKLYVQDRWSERRISEGIVLDFNDLKQLVLSICMPRLPDEQHFPAHLTTISLTVCRLKEDPMPILEKLLQLKEVNLAERSFCGRRMVCSSGGFPQLKKLSLYALYEWKEWIIEEGSMPLLHTLYISSCNELNELPDGLRFITSLKDLSVYNWGKEWKQRLSEGGEDHYKVQHIPSFRHYGW